MIDLGDYSNNLARVGGYSIVRAKPATIGLVLHMPVSKFPLGSQVTMKIDGRSFTGHVVLAEGKRVTLAGSEHDCAHINLEGRFE